MRRKQVRPPRHGRRRLLVPLPVLPKIALIYDCHLPIFPPSSLSSSSTHASSSSSSSSSPSGPLTEMSSGSGTRIGHGIAVCVVDAEGAEERENGNSPFTGLHLFPLANLGFPPDVGDVCTGTRGNDMLLTMGNIPGGVDGERVLTYSGVGVGADAYQCSDTGKTMAWCHLPEGCELRVGEDRERLRGRRAAGAGARAGRLGPTSVSAGAGRAYVRPTVAARQGKRTVEEAPGDGPHRVDEAPLEQEGDKQGEACSCKASELELSEQSKTEQQIGKCQAKPKRGTIGPIRGSMKKTKRGRLVPVRRGGKKHLKLGVLQWLLGLKHALLVLGGLLLSVEVVACASTSPLHFG
ncbi:hypothetical protein B0H14DRAFT_3156488 [Mycena olivaceomarginata]|nr:hypothetical protein B0H14DRAFT_3156488 [Mycena olivaceomarginata]